MRKKVVLMFVFLLALMVPFAAQAEEGREVEVTKEQQVTAAGQCVAKVAEVVGWLVGHHGARRRRRVRSERHSEVVRVCPGVREQLRQRMVVLLLELHAAGICRVRQGAGFLPSRLQLPQLVQLLERHSRLFVLSSRDTPAAGGIRAMPPALSANQL